MKSWGPDLAEWRLAFVPPGYVDGRPVLRIHEARP